jgi:hypothetical protein
VGPIDVLRSWAVQDSPPGAATAALVARVQDVPVGWLDTALYEERTAVALYNPRSATAIVPADEAAAFGSAFLPSDDEGLKAIVGRAVPEQEAGFAAPVQLAVDAISEALDGKTLSRDDLHERLRQNLPKALLPWCPSCESHHARRGLLIMAALHGRLCIADRVGRQPAFARTDQLVGWKVRKDAAQELVRRYHVQYGPSNVSHFAEWAGLGRAHAREIWSESDQRAEQLDGVRLLAPGDPILMGRDRETLVPDPELRKQVFKAIGGAGIVLVDGEFAGTWHARKQGKTLAVSTRGKIPRKPVEQALERLLPHRGCVALSLQLG